MTTEMQWTGRMLLISLKRHLTPAVFNLIPNNIVFALDDDTRVFFPQNGIMAILLDLRQYFQSAKLVYDSYDTICQNIIQTREISGSAQYYQMGMCLDCFRSPVGYSFFLPKQEMLFQYALSIVEMISEGHMIPMIRPVAVYEMNKIARQIGTFELVFNDDSLQISQEMVLKVVEDATRSSLKEFEIMKKLNRAQFKKQSIQLVFGKEDNYLIPFFNLGFDSVFTFNANHDRTVSYRDIFSHIVNIRKVMDYYLKTLLKRFSSSNQKLDTEYLEKPIIRRFRAFEDDERRFLFTEEVVSAINTLHRISGDGKTFEKKLYPLPYDSNEIHFNFISFEELESLCEKEGVKKKDITFIGADNFSSGSALLTNDPISSPIYTLSISAGDAFLEFQLKLFQHTNHLMTLNQKHFANLKTYFDTFHKIFDPEKKNYYNIDYNSFLGLMEKTYKKLDSFAKKVVPPKCTISMDINGNIMPQFDWFPMKFGKTKQFFREVFHSCGGPHELTLGLNRVLGLAFMAEFPKFSLFAHNQMICSRLGMCLLEFVTDGSADGMKKCCDKTASQILSELNQTLRTSKHTTSPKPSNMTDERAKNTFSGLKRGFFNKSAQIPNETQTLTSPNEEKSSTKSVKTTEAGSSCEKRDDKDISINIAVPNATSSSVEVEKEKKETEFDENLDYIHDKDELQRAIAEMPPSSSSSTASVLKVQTPGTPDRSSKNEPSTVENFDKVESSPTEICSLSEKPNDIVKQNLEVVTHSDVSLIVLKSITKEFLKQTEQLMKEEKTLDNELSELIAGEEVDIEKRTYGREFMLTLRQIEKSSKEVESTSKELEMKMKPLSTEPSLFKTRMLHIERFCKKLKEFESDLLNSLPDEKYEITELQGILKNVLKSPLTSEDLECLNSKHTASIFSPNWSSTVSASHKKSLLRDTAIENNKQEKLSEKYMSHSSSINLPSNTSNSSSEKGIEPEWQKAYMYGKNQGKGGGRMPREDEDDDLRDEPAIPLTERVILKSKKSNASKLDSARVAGTSSKRASDPIEKASLPIKAQQKKVQQEGVKRRSGKNEKDFDTESDEEINENNREGTPRMGPAKSSCTNCRILIDKAIDDGEKIESMEFQLNKLELEKVKEEMKIKSLERNLEQMEEFNRDELEELNSKIVNLDNRNREKDAVISELERKLKESQYEMETLRREKEKAMNESKLEKATAAEKLRNAEDELTTYKLIHDELSAKYQDLEFLNNRLLCNEADNVNELKALHERIEQLEEQLENGQQISETSNPNNAESVENQFKEPEPRLAEMNETEIVDTPSSSSSAESFSLSTSNFNATGAVDETVPERWEDLANISTTSQETNDVLQQGLSKQVEKEVYEKLNELKEYANLLSETNLLEAANQILNSYIASSGNSKNARSAESQFAKYIDEYNSFNDLVLTNIHRLESYPVMETLNSLKPLPNLPSPFTIREMTQIEKQCKSSTSAWNIEPKKEANFEVEKSKKTSEESSKRSCDDLLQLWQPPAEKKSKKEKTDIVAVLREWTDSINSVRNKTEKLTEAHRDHHHVSLSNGRGIGMLIEANKTLTGKVNAVEEKIEDLGKLITAFLPPPPPSAPSMTSMEGEEKVDSETALAPISVGPWDVEMENSSPSPPPPRANRPVVRPPPGTRSLLAHPQAEEQKIGFLARKETTTTSTNKLDGFYRIPKKPAAPKVKESFKSTRPMLKATKDVCLFCGENHRSQECNIYTTALARMNTLKMRKLCPSCGLHEFDGTCPYAPPVCGNCRGRHQTALCGKTYR